MSFLSCIEIEVHEMKKIILLLLFPLTSLLSLIGCKEEKALKHGTKITELVKNPEYICFQSPYELEENFKRHVYRETGKEIKNFKWQDNGTVIWIYDSESLSFKKFKLNLHANQPREDRCYKISENNLKKLVLNIDEDNHTFFIDSIGDK